MRKTCNRSPRVRVCVCARSISTHLLVVCRRNRRSTLKIMEKNKFSGNFTASFHIKLELLLDYSVVRFPFMTMRINRKHLSGVVLFYSNWDSTPNWKDSAIELSNGRSEKSRVTLVAAAIEHSDVFWTYSSLTRYSWCINNGEEFFWVFWSTKRKLEK